MVAPDTGPGRGCGPAKPCVRLTWSWACECSLVSGTIHITPAGSASVSINRERHSGHTPDALAPRAQPGGSDCLAMVPQCKHRVSAGGAGCGTRSGTRTTAVIGTRGRRCQEREKNWGLHRGLGAVNIVGLF